MAQYLVRPAFYPGVFVLALPVIRYMDTVKCTVTVKHIGPAEKADVLAELFIPGPIRVWSYIWWGYSFGEDITPKTYTLTVEEKVKDVAVPVGDYDVLGEALIVAKAVYTTPQPIFVYRKEPAWTISASWVKA